jgi:hypothetical protein
MKEQLRLRQEWLVRTGRMAGPGAVRTAALEEAESDLESDRRV